MIWLDGVRAEALPLPDRGLDFGDGLFETLLLRRSEPLHSELHLARLGRGCERLAFPDCVATARKQLQSATLDIGGRGWHWSVLRITVTRGAGPRGYAPPHDPVPRIVISASHLGDAPSRMAPPAALGLASVRLPTQPALAGLKHLNRLEHVMAAREYRQMEVDEAVMLDQQGSVISVVAGNLFLVREGRLVTAPLDKCGIAGTRRDLVMRRWAPALGLTAAEETVTTSQLEAADEVFYCNSLLGLRPVARFGQRSWSRHEVCGALYRQYQGELA